MRKLLRREKDYYANNAYANFLRLMCAKRYMGLNICARKVCMLVPKSPAL